MEEKNKATILGGGEEGNDLLSLLVPPKEESNPEEGTLLGGQPESDSAKPAPQPEGEAEEEAEEEYEEGQSGEEERETPLYTEEEFSNLLEKNPLDVDPERVPRNLMPAYKAALRAYKNFQADYTRKTQQLKETKKTNAPKDIYEAYEQDPEGVMAHLDAQILKAKDEGDLVEASTLLNLKTSLLEYKMKNLEKQTKAERQFQDVYAYVREQIPDFDSKVKELRRFAIEEMGFTEEEIDKLTDPSITGMLAAKLTLAVNKAYELANPQRALKKKEVKPQPPKLGYSGVSSSGAAEGIPAGKIASMSIDEFNKLLQKVKSQMRR